MNQVEIGKLIKVKRKEKNLTQTELAEKVNISSYKTISKWENGIYMPDISLLIQLSEILDVSLYELLGGKENMKEENVEKVLKNTLENINEKNKLLKLLKQTIIILSTILIIITTIFIIYLSYLTYDDYKYLFSIKPTEISIQTINQYHSFYEVNEDNFYTKYFKGLKQIGIEEALCKQLPLYETKNFYHIKAEKNKIVYTFNPNDNETSINGDFNDNNYTKKSMYIIAIVLYKCIGNLESIEFNFNDTKYNITQELMDEYYNFNTKIVYIDGNSVFRKFLNIDNFNNMIDNDSFLDEFFNKAKV